MGTGQNGCSPDPCLNAGLCQQLAGGQYMCICLPAFTGQNCQTSTQMSLLENKSGDEKRKLNRVVFFLILRHTK